MKIAVLIPSYRPSDILIKLAKELICQNFCSVFVVDDGSGEEYEPIFSALSLLGCSVVHHERNRGKGAALKTGIAELRKTIGALDAVITADGDGQHAPDDIRKIGESLAAYPDSLILGVRDFSGSHVPAKSRFGNRFSSVYFKLSTHVACPDTQTGLRGIPARLFSLALSVPGERYEYEMAFLTAAAKENIPIRFTPIRTIYFNQNAESHFRPFADSVRIYRTPLKYLCASLLCAVVDLGGFSVLSSIIPAGVWFRVLEATVLARMLSGALNFTLNRLWAFENRQAAGSQAAKYTVLFFFQMCASWLLVSVLSEIPLPLTVIKIPVDCTLFVFSYFAQLNWVFRRKNIQKKEA